MVLQRVVHSFETYLYIPLYTEIVCVTGNNTTLRTVSSSGGLVNDLRLLACRAADGQGGCAVSREKWLEPFARRPSAPTPTSEVDELVDAVTTQLRQRILDKPVYPESATAVAGTARAEADETKSAALERHAAINAEVDHLRLATVRRSWQRVELDSARQRTANRAGRALLWLSLFTYGAIQIGLIARFCWQIIHPASFFDLLWPTMANLASGVGGAYTARHLIKGTSRAEHSPEELTKSIDEMVNSSDELP